MNVQAICPVCCKNFISIGETGRPRKYCSAECRQSNWRNWPSQIQRKSVALSQYREKQCPMCQTLFDATSAQQKYCSSRCCRRFNTNFKAAKGSEIRCIRCSKVFVNGNGRAKYCSRTCKRAGTHSDYRSRAKRWNVEFDPTVTIVNVIERFGRGCAECGELIIGEHSSKANQDGPSLDHIIPMSAGGAHIWTNVELVHLRCNLKRWSSFRKALVDACE